MARLWINLVKIKKDKYGSILLDLYLEDVYSSPEQEKLGSFTLSEGYFEEVKHLLKNLDNPQKK